MVLAGLFGAVVLVQFRSEQTDIIDEGLHDRYFAVQRALAAVPPKDEVNDVTSSLPRGEGFAQVLDGQGNVLAASPRALADSLVLAGMEIRHGLTLRSSLVRSVAPGATNRKIHTGRKTGGAPRASRSGQSPAKPRPPGEDGPVGLAAPMHRARFA